MGARVLVVGQFAAADWIDDLEADRYRVDELSAAADVGPALESESVSCVVLVAESAGSGGGDDAQEPVDPLTTLAAVRAVDRDVPVLLASAEPDGELAAAATRRGVTEYYARSSSASLADRVRAHLRSRDGSTECIDSVAARRAATDGSGTENPSVSHPDLTPAATGLTAVKDGVYLIDMEGRFLDVNESLAEMTGYSVGELLGEPIWLILADSSEGEPQPAVRRVIDGETDSAVIESRLDPKSGDPFPVEDHLTAVREDGEVVCLAGVLRDVSDKHERREELERYEAIIEAIDDGVYALDDEGQFEVVNDALLELTGFDRTDLLGEHTSVVKDEQTVQRAENKLRDLIHGNVVETTFEFSLQPRTGGSIEAEDHMTMLTDEDGDFAGTAGVIRDITDRKERERELRRARERFADLLDSSRGLLEAHSREAVADVVVESVADTLGYDFNHVRLVDSETGTLEPVAGSGDGLSTMADRPIYETGEGGPGRALESGTTLRAPDEVAIDAVDMPGPLVETLYVPIGDRGTVSIGATEAGTFDDQDRSMAEILASNAAVALDRVDFEEDLVEYRTVLENVQDMVYVTDEAGRFSLVTEPLAEWLGIERDEMVGRHVESVVEASSPLTNAADSVRAGDSDHVTVETAFERSNGERLPGEVEVSLLSTEEPLSGTVGVVRDRSELVETREQLESERDRFTYLFDNLPDAVVEASLDETGKPVVKTVNDAFESVFGYDTDTITGESLNDYIVPDTEKSQGRKLDKAAGNGETVQREVRRKTADGYRDFLFRGVPYDTGVNGINSFGIYTDISDQKERERRLQVLNRVLRHNLRNDLNVVLGYAEMIDQRVDDETLSEWSETLIETAEDLASLSDRARTLDRTMREGSLRDYSVEIQPVVDEVVAEYRSEFSDATFDVDVDDVSVVGDARIELALTELLENSVEYGGEQVHAHVETDQADDRVALSVADDGPGIPDHERAIVDDSVEISQLEHGSGLGLWIVRWVCDSCGGRLRFEETEMGGTRVTLSLTPAEE